MASIQSSSHQHDHNAAVVPLETWHWWMLLVKRFGTKAIMWQHFPEGLEGEGLWWKWRDFSISIWDEAGRGSALMPLLALAPWVSRICGSLSHLSQAQAAVFGGLRLQGLGLQLMVGRMPCLPGESTRPPLTLEKWVTVLAKDKNHTLLLWWQNILPFWGHVYHDIFVFLCVTLEALRL